MDIERLIELITAGDDVSMGEVATYLSTSADAVARADSGDAKIAELVATIEANEKTINALKAHNYDLLTANSVGEPTEEIDSVDEEQLTIDDMINGELKLDDLLK